MKQPVTCLETMAYVYAACAVRVTIFNSGGKFQPISNFTKLHTLTPAAHFHTLLITCISLYS